MATVYELIQELVEYPPDAELRFNVGGLTGYSWDVKFYSHSGHENILNPELFIIIEE